MKPCSACLERRRVRIAIGMIEAANALGVSPLDLATVISYETAGTFDPLKRGPTTQWGQHRGLIQFGVPQAADHGVDWDRPVESQLGPNGAVVSYMKTAGVKPGHGLLDMYSAVNAGYVGRYSRTDENNGGAPGTVRDKVNRMQRDGHLDNARRHLAYAEECACLDRTSNDSTVIHGDYDAAPCLRTAGLMAIDVYNNPFENVAEVLHADYAKIDTHWDRLWERGISMTGASPKSKQRRAEEIAAPNPARPERAPVVERNHSVVEAASGMFCRLYAPKNGTDPQGNPTCPPVLAFRGSEMQKDELRSLAVTLQLRVDYLTRNRTDGGELQDGAVLTRAHLFWPIDVGEGWEEAVSGISVTTTPPDRSLLQRLGDLHDALSEVADIDLFPDGEALPEQMQAQIDDLGLANAQSVLQSEGATRIEPVTAMGRAIEYAVGYEMWARYDAKITLHYDEGGDWGANVTQAMGLIGAQYEGIVAAVDKAIPTAEARGNRLTITGHSLGGGLSQAAAIYCHRAYPHIKLKCIHFNAAGLHQMTAREMNRGTREDARNFPMYAKSVSGELLTSVQTPGVFPFVWNIFNWQSVKIPDAVGLPDQRRAISPGPFPVGGPDYHDFLTPEPPYPNRRQPASHVPDGELLPFVLPLETQNRFTSPDHRYVTERVYPRSGGYTGSGIPLDDHRLNTPDGYEYSALDELVDQSVISDRGPADLGEFPKTVTRLIPQTPTPDRFPHIEAILGFADSAVDFDTFVKKTVSYLIEQAGEDVSRQLEDASFLERLSPLAILLRMLAGLSNTTADFKAEAGKLGELIAICLAYHPMDIGGSTFLRPPED